MQSPPILPNEAERLAALEDTKLLFSPAEERFDRVSRLAARLLGVPISLISLVDDTRQWFKAVHGLNVLQTPREVSFCAHAIAAGDRLVVEDASLDERFANNPLVTGEPHVRAYVGEVIRSSSGQPLGTLCVLDSQPRHFTEDELSLLDDLAAIAEVELRRTETRNAQSQLLREMEPETREQSLDAVTRCWNQDAMVELLMRQAQQSEISKESFAVGLIDIERLRHVSERLGAEAHDQVLRELAIVVKRLLREGDALGRYDDERFIVLLGGADERTAGASANRIRQAIHTRSFQAGRLSVQLGAAIGICQWTPGASLVALVEATERALKQAQQETNGIAVLPQC